jgi:hypothetical protein
MSVGSSGNKNMLRKFPEKSRSVMLKRKLHQPVKKCRNRSRRSPR